MSEALEKQIGATIELAYNVMLTIPHGESRSNLQSALASLRDEIARRQGRYPQDIQDEFEAKWGRR